MKFKFEMSSVEAPESDLCGLLKLQAIHVIPRLCKYVTFCMMLIVIVTIC
jgi:hypothetical protein